MYNAAGSLTTGVGAATLAMTGANDALSLVTGVAFALIAIGGVFFLHASRVSKKKVNSEVS